MKLPNTSRGFLSGPQSCLEDFSKVGFPMLCKAISEIAVTSAPVSILKGMTLPLIITSADQVVVVDTVECCPRLFRYAVSRGSPPPPKLKLSCSYRPEYSDFSCHTSSMMQPLLGMIFGHGSSTLCAESPGCLWLVALLSAAVAHICTTDNFQRQLGRLRGHLGSS